MEPDVEIYDCDDRNSNEESLYSDKTKWSVPACVGGGGASLSEQTFNRYKADTSKQLSKYVIRVPEVITAKRINTNH